mmetsp:Transcript_7571/g.13164  ORF Transcript_7571/g.13164 Transcript_7571/m.13164 type:complete len:97 (-) Transcript_7571:29-319(-)
MPALRCRLLTLRCRLLSFPRSSLRQFCAVPLHIATRRRAPANAEIMLALFVLEYPERLLCEEKEEINRLGARSDIRMIRLILMGGMLPFHVHIRVL